MSYQQAIKGVETSVFKLASSVSQLKKLVDVLGTARDTVNHRHKIAEVNSSIQSLAKSIKDQLTSLHEDRANVPSEQQEKCKKLLSDFSTILQDYKSTQKIAAERELASLPRPNPTTAQQAAAAAAAGDQPELEIVIEKQALLQQQQERKALLLNNAVEYNEALIEERDQGIAEISRQIGEVNEMFQDLAVLINDQGVQVRTIDEHITTTAERTKEATRELMKAERSQRAYRNKCLWLWLIAAIVVSIIIILITST